MDVTPTAKIPERIHAQLHGALDNLKFCELLCDFLEESHGWTVPTTVTLKGPNRTVVVPGENCGFVVTPVIHNAILDIRRILPFLGLAYSQKTQSFSHIQSPQWPDDYWIGDLGLPPVTVSELDAVSHTLCNQNSLSVFEDILTYSNKQLAHFSKAESLPKLEKLSNGSRLASSAVMIFVYDALSLPRPELHLKTEEG
jgi:hypothetical protein